MTRLKIMKILDCLDTLEHMLNEMNENSDAIFVNDMYVKYKKLYLNSLK